MRTEGLDGTSRYPLAEAQRVVQSPNLGNVFASPKPEIANLGVPA